jgi:Flp pilus assembly protein TadG
MLVKLLKLFCKDRRGNVMTVMGIVALPLLLAVTTVIELGSVANERNLLQDAADAGALAGATKLNIVTDGTASATVAQTAQEAALMALGQNNALKDVAFDTDVDTQKGLVNVVATASHNPLFGFLNFSKAGFRVTSVAETLNQVPMCILQTAEATKLGGIELNNTASIKAPGCAIHANESINVKNSASIYAGRVQAVGMVKGNVSPAGQGGAMAIDDPFASMNLKPPVKCPPNLPNIAISSLDTYTLLPGVHCGIFTVSGNATLMLMPGEHYFEGQFTMKGNSKLIGHDVVLIFGTDDSFDFSQKTLIRLKARTSGPFAGFLIATSRSNIETFSISSNMVEELLGTIYIPNSVLDISATGNVAQASAWSIIVAQCIKMTNNPVLVINKNYAGSGVPRPDKVGDNTHGIPPHLIH